MRNPRLLLLPLIVGVGLIAACNTQGGGGGASPSPTGSAGAPAVKITRSGGFAGVNQSVEIAPDGSWVYTDVKKGSSQRGALTDDQRAQLLRVVSAPDFVAQLTEPQAPTPCRDAFNYTLRVGEHQATFVDCGGEWNPAVSALVKLVSDATPL